MPITVDHFADKDATGPLDRSGGYDPERSFLFDGLAPRFATQVVRGIQIAMRDGTQLSTDFHIPLGAPLPLPVILLRTPYSKAVFRNALPHVFPEQGFIYAVQDVRGRYESQGQFVACGADDRQDGWDTIEWLVDQPWCSGSIGMIGSSYTGETTVKAAATLHPALKACIIQFDGGYSGGNSQNGAYLQGGVTMLRMMFGWYRDYVPEVSYGPPPHIDREEWFAGPWAQTYATQPVALPPVDDAHLMTLPVHDLLDRAGAPPSAFGEQMRRSADPSDPFWNAQGFATEADRFDVPALHVTGPLERGGSGFDNFRLFRDNAVSARARDNQKLLFTPAPHSMIHLSGPDTRYGLRNFGDTRFPYYLTYVEWFGHWLRGDNNMADDWPAVQYYTANRNAWSMATTWPPEGTRDTSLYLGAGGSLGFSAPLRAGSDQYSYDPAAPTPSDPPGAELDILGGGYVDRTRVEARDDVLIYTTDVMTEELTIAGPVNVTLFVSSSAKDTDFVATLVDVQPDGTPINITHGIARMRYLDGFDRRVWMEPGTTYRVTIDLWHAAATFPPGHRIRLEVASSSFPAWDRNLNTGGDNYTDTDWIVADNIVHHGGDTPSAIILPLTAAV